MRRTQLLGMIGITALAACETPMQPTHHPGLGDIGAPNAAVVQNDQIQTTAFAISDCTGELVVFPAARFHFLTAVTVSSSGTFHVKQLVGAQGQGTNTVTGAQYVANQAVNLEFNAQAGIEETQTIHFNLIGKG